MFPRPRPLPDKTRIARFLAKGYPAQAVAAAEKLGPDEMKALLGDQGFRGLVDWFRRLHALPPEERLQRLVQHAMEVLEKTLLAGNLRAGSFIVAENKAGRHPASTLARRVAACLDAVPPEARSNRHPPGPPRRPTLAPGSRPHTRQLGRKVEFHELVEATVGQNSMLHELDQAADAAAAPQAAEASIHEAGAETGPPRVEEPAEPIAAAPDSTPVGSSKLSRQRPSPAPESKRETGPLPPFVPGMAVGLGAPAYAANTP